MDKITFKQFLSEYKTDPGSLALQKQVADKKAAEHEFRDQGAEDFEDLKQRARDPNRPLKGDIIVGKDGTQFRVASDKAVKGKDGWKLPLVNMKTKEQTWTDYNRKYQPTGKKTDLGKRYLSPA